jgi:hypothetical protein
MNDCIMSSNTLIMSSDALYLSFSVVAAVQQIMVCSLIRPVVGLSGNFLSPKTTSVQRAQYTCHLAGHPHVTREMNFFSCIPSTSVVTTEPSTLARKYAVYHLQHSCGKCVNNEETNELHPLVHRCVLISPVGAV